MKFIDKLNNLIAKHGADKALHFTLGGWITSIFSIFGCAGLFIGFLITIIAAWYKEKYMDAVYDEKDIKYSIYGGLISLVIGCFFCIL